MYFFSLLSVLTLSCLSLSLSAHSSSHLINLSSSHRHRHWRRQSGLLIHRSRHRHRRRQSGLSSSGLLIRRSRHRHRRRQSCCSRRGVDFGGVDCVVGFVLIPGCWIVLLGCVDSGLLGLFFWFVFLVYWVCCRWIVWIPVWYRCGLLGLFFWVAGLVAGGMCGFRCDTGVGRWLCRKRN